MVNECNIACLIAVGMFTGQLYVMFNYNKKKLLDKFSSLLNDEQRTTYKSIISERIKLYVNGMLIGIVLGLAYLYMSPSKSIGRACIFTMIVLGTNYFYYILTPKSNYMVPHLTTKEQRIAWLNIYREMPYRCKMGLLLGLVSYFILGYFMDMKN